MVHILSDIVSLKQYLNLLAGDPDYYRLEQCLCCGKSNPWRHGSYPRNADRINPSHKSYNPVFIQRYYCPKCKKTCSVLPECIPPHRWYLWEMQEVVFLLYIAGVSICAVAKETLPSRQTISRWVRGFKEKLCVHKDALSVHFINLGRTCYLGDFWQATLKIMNLGKAMRLCHLAGVTIP